MDQWRKSTASNPSGNCVEVQQVGPEVWMRNSRYPDDEVLCVYTSEWQAFVDGVKKGEFDFG